VAALDDLPGFRRRIVVRPEPGRVRADVEDDYHRMGVTVAHDGTTATSVQADMARVPWTTCPGAPAVLAATFTGVPLAGFVARGEKTMNCTHLHDLALLAAAHALDARPTVYDILVSDPQGGVAQAELRRGGEAVLGWTIAGWAFTAPAHLAGLTLDALGPWIATLDREGQEQARLLRWGTILAHGRATRIAGGGRYDKAQLPRGQCYTFQPETAERAEYRPGTVLDFAEGRTPLAELVD
jgi:hypothetical protein